MWLWALHRPLTFGWPSVINMYTHTQHTHTLTISGFTNTPSRLAFPPPNQFATLLSETLFNVPQLFLLPLLFNTLLYYPLISPSLSPVSPAPLYLLWAVGGSATLDLHITPCRFQRTGDLSDTDTVQTALARRQRGRKRLRALAYARRRTRRRPPSLSRRLTL